jgi:hypothetical protein
MRHKVKDEICLIKEIYLFNCGNLRRFFTAGMVIGNRVNVNLSGKVFFPALSKMIFQQQVNSL